eukprot:5308691-Pyramimonas_sp.AAC.1
MAINHYLSCVLCPQLLIIARTIVSSKASASDVWPAGAGPMMLRRTVSLTADPCRVPCQLVRSQEGRRSCLSPGVQRKSRICSMVVSQPMA